MRPSTPSLVPAWLTIFVLMLMVIISINPSAKDFTWFRSLRRPAWMGFHIWLPMVWLLIYGGVYLGAVRAWEESGSLLVVACFLALVALVEIATWFLAAPIGWGPVRSPCWVCGVMGCCCSWRCGG
jgi:tryptophan-rich sensory protein